MMTIQKPKRMWQKKKDYMRKKTIRGLRRKGKRILQSFDDGTDDIRKQIETQFPSSKAFGTILPDYTIIADPTFTKDKTGAGEIEYFNEPEITYSNGYKKINPVKGPSLVYNPNSQTEEDIKLDLLHHYREYDPVYQDLLKDYTDTQDPGQILYNSELGEYFRNLPKEQQTDKNWNKLVKENLNSQYMIQGIDGSLRGLMASDKLRSLGRYPSRTIYEKENLNSNAARMAYQNIVNYLTSERLPEVIVKPKRYKKGKDCFDIGTDDGQQMIYQDGDQYFAGPNINAATTKVTPYIQRIPNDKSTWDFIDDSGKLYTTKYSDDQLKQLYGQNTPESEFYNWIDRSGKEHRQMKIIPVSPVDPVGEMAVETALGAPLFKGAGWAGKQLVNDFVKDFGYTRLGNWVRNKILSNALNKNIKAWGGTDELEYFNSPYKLYRRTETPKIQSKNINKLTNDDYDSFLITDDDQIVMSKERDNALDLLYGKPRVQKSGDGYIIEKIPQSVKDNFKYTIYPRLTKQQRFQYNMRPIGEGENMYVIDDSVFKRAGESENLRGFYLPDDKVIKIRKPDMRTSDNFDNVVDHEYHHYIDDTVHQTSEQQELYKNAYTYRGFGSDKTEMEQYMKDFPVEERPTTNSDIRNQLLSNEERMLNVDEQNKIINNKSTEDLLNAMDFSYYSRTLKAKLQSLLKKDNTKGLERINAIKQALMYAPALTPIITNWFTEENSQNHNSGKDIHIKKANRGKFTETANEHNMGVQEFARQVLSAPKGKYSSTLRKRANFARNFAH